MARVTLDQINIIGADLDATMAFYRRLGVDFPEARIWRTASGAHHINAADPSGGQPVDLDLDSAAFAQIWNAGWKGRPDLAGRVVLGFGVEGRDDVDTLFADMTGAGYPGLQPPYDAPWGARYAVIEDPDGLAVGLMSPVDADRRWPTSEP